MVLLGFRFMQGVQASGRSGSHAGKKKKEKKEVENDNNNNKQEIYNLQGRWEGGEKNPER